MTATTGGHVVKRTIAIAFIALAIPSCASTGDGTTQKIDVNTKPQGAHCKLSREGKPVGEIAKTPATVTIRPTRHNLVIECGKDGFHKSTYYNSSVRPSSPVGSIFLGGGRNVFLGVGLGFPIDAGSGPDNIYTSPVNIEMVPSSEPKPKPVYPREEEDKARGVEYNFQ